LATDGRNEVASSAALHGRDHERASLVGLLAQVRGGRSGTLVLRGEAGIGKTVLLQHLLASAHGFTVARCAGVESEMELAFAGLHDLCSPFLGHLDSLPDPQRGAISSALGLTAGVSPDKFLVAVGALGLLAAASESAPILWVVEDAHWLDQASAQVLGFIGRRLLAEPVALVFAARPSLALPDHLAGLPELRIDGLDNHSANALLDSVTVTTPVDRSIRGRIIDETRGNPLALLELGARMMTPDFAGGFSAVDPPSLSRRIEHEYLTRLHALPQDTQDLLLLAAAEPAGDPALIRRAAGELKLTVHAADAAVDAGLLGFGASVRFRHPLLRSAVYRAATIERRRRAHAALAAAGDSELQPDRCAWHRAYAAPAADEEVASELIGSADRALARGGLAAAAAFWERAVALTPDSTDRASRALVAAQAKYGAGDMEAAHRLLVEAEIGPLTELDQATVALLRGQMAFTRYRGGESPSLLLSAAIRLQALDVDLARDTYLQALIATAHAGRFGDEDVRLQICRGAQALPLEPTTSLSRHLLVRGFATWMADGYVAGAAILNEALQHYRNEPTDPGFYGWGFNVMAMHLCDDDAWHAMVVDQVALAREHGLLSWLPLAFDSLAEFSVHAGELSKAEALLIEANLIDPIITAGTSLHIALLLDAWRSDASGAATRIAAMVEATSGRGEGWLLDFVEYAKAVLYNGLADYSLAADAAETVVAKMNTVPCYGIRALYELVEATTRSNQMDRARSATAQMAEVASAAGSDFALGMAAQCRAFVADDDEADALYQEAIEYLGRTRMAIFLARSHLNYGEWLRRRGRRIDARTQLRPAYAALLTMGANGFAERARRELLATGEKVRRRTESSSNELTPQEEQIAQLARERRTNPEIGAQLFLSARTVEWHLRNIFAKLEISSRRELNAALERRARL
jgi:DNA-binding CsgD family transcriptional regulator